MTSATIRVFRDSDNRDSGYTAELKEVDDEPYASCKMGRGTKPEYAVLSLLGDMLSPPFVEQEGVPF